MSFVDDKYGDAIAESSPQKEQRSVIHFLWVKGLCPNAICSEIVYVQYMVTSVLQDQQYIVGVRSLLVNEKALLMKKDLADVLF